MMIIIKKCASAHITFWALIYMMLLLIFGTVSQKYIGLYGALDKYFYSWIIWGGFIPLPGGLAVMGVFFVNLLARFLGYSVWTREKAGIHLAHLGVILLLIGGIVSAVSRTDNALPIMQNEMRGYVQSYDQSALTLYKNGLRIEQFALKDINDQDDLSLTDHPFDLAVSNVCLNCQIKIDQKHGGMTLVDSLPDKDPEQNLSGLTFNVNFKDGRLLEKHLAFLFFPKPPKFEINGDEYILTVERFYSPLPFAIKLVDFSVEYYPGTNRARSYQSNIQIIDDGTSTPARISMNKPLSYKGYKFYQSAFEVNPQGEYTSIFAVVYNEGRIFPYLAAVILSLGLLMHIAFKIRGRISQSSIRFATLVLILFLAVPQIVKADIIVGSDFKTLPVLHEGRIKPIDSFARLNMKEFSGKQNPLGEGAAETLARIIFNPYDAVGLEVFKIDNDSILSSFGLAAKQSKLYSYAQISKGLDRTRPEFIKILNRPDMPSDLNEYQNDLVKIHSQGLYFLQLVRSFSFAMPLEGSDENKILDYKALQKNTVLLRNALAAIREEKGDDLNSYSAEEKETAYMNYQLDLLEQTGRNNVLLRVIPSSDPREILTAPWQILSGGKGTPQTAQYLELWVRLMVAHQADRQDIWDRTIADLQKLYMPIRNNTSLHAEYIYNVFNPINLSIILSFFAALLFVVSRLHPGVIVTRSAKAMAYSLPVLLGGTVLFRTVLLERPPVGTLYESVIFVCLIISAGVIFLARLNKKNTLFIPAFLLCGFLLVLGRSIDSGSDNLQMMEAVLNTNFWLATHVLIITAGYGWCLLTSALAHLELYSKKISSQNSQLHTHALISLFLISLGTILGGIWADMSWGRFWGWDPKENGALLIALWLIWCLHSRASNHLSDFTFKICLALLSIIIMLSWFGVNLLNVGLHSYGFISGLASALVCFIIFEIVCIGGLAWRIKKS